LKTPTVLLNDEIGKNGQGSTLRPLEVSTKKDRRKRYISTRTKAPLHSSCEIPILSVLAKSPSIGLRTRIVLKEVEGKWFKELTTIDLSAVYPNSKRKVVETIIKFAKKNLAGKGEIHPTSGENFGIWKATAVGLERAMKAEGKWIPKYVRVSSMIEAGEENL